ncbi:MAG: hypothetical protein FWD83_08045 [Promicromonosporaceae bacterium]|nr:hypothetical protein [Promicromonosporaceae bacterium]
MSGPNSRRVIREAINSANRRPWRTLTVGLAVLVMCLSVFITTGQSVGVERRVREQMESESARLISITWRVMDGGIDPSAVERINTLTGVEWALGRSPALDLTNYGLHGGNPCPAVAVVGELPPQAIGVTTGRAALAGEAMVTAAAANCLGLMQPAGTVTPASARQTVVTEPVFAVVGGLDVGEALAQIANFTFLRTNEPVSLVEIFIQADEARNIPAITEAALRLTGVPDLIDLSVTSSEAMLELNAILERELAANSRIIAAVVLAAGMGFTGLALALSVGAQRRDFGRRRALGASRSLLMSLVLLEGAIPALLGAIAGTSIGIITLALLHDVTPDLAFALSVPALALIAVLIASIPAALTAAYRDPVAILRVP